MRRRMLPVFLVSFFALCLAVSISSCSTLGGQGPPVKDQESISGGPYVFELGEVKKAGFDTAPYIPEKIRFELDKRLRQRGLLVTQSAKEKRLIVEIEVRASYSGIISSHSCSDCYHDISSHVWVKKEETGEVVAERVVRSLNSSVGVVSVSDFTEITHAKEIADFLEQIVR